MKKATKVNHPLKTRKKIRSEELKKAYYLLFKKLNKEKINDYLYLEK